MDRRPFFRRRRIGHCRIDEAHGAHPIRYAGEYLIELGHRRIGVITGPPISPINRDRLTGATAAAARHGLALQVRTGDYSAQSAFAWTADLIADDVTALFCFSDEMAMGAIGAVGDAGLTCPDDISIIGFDDLPLARFFPPALITIAQSKGMIGRRTVELLVNILNGTENLANQITLAHELVVRHSTRAIDRTA